MHHTKYQKSPETIPGWFKKDMKFVSKWIAGGNNVCTIISFDVTTNLATVHIKTDTTEFTEDGWNLQHTINGFKRGDYWHKRDQAKDELPD